MNIKIKKRIELIRKGILPENYENNDAGLMPQDWKISKLGNQIDLLTDYHANGSYERLRDNVTLIDESGYAIMVRTTNFENKDFTKDVKYIDEHAYIFLKKSKVYPDDIIINKIANAGAVYIMPDLNRPVSLAMNTFLLRTNKCNSKYLYQYLKYNEHRLRVLATGTSTKTITKDDVRNLPINIPDKVEQNQICKILSTWDKAIELKEQFIEEKKKQKSGLMQKLLTGKVRLPGFDGEINCVKLEKYIEEVKKKNKSNEESRVLSVTNKQGFILQEDQFDRIVASKDLSNYKIVKKGEFAYNPSRVNVGSIDLLKNFESGLLSPMYVVFKCKENLNSDYLNHFIKSEVFLNIIPNMLQGSVRDSLSFDSLKLIKLFIPSLEEQKAIAKVLDTADKEIHLLEKELESLKLQKKGLMQLLLTGIVRVQC